MIFAQLFEFSVFSLVLHRYHFLPILPIPILHFSVLADTNTDTDTGDPWAEPINQFQQRTRNFLSADSTNGLRFVNGTNEVELVPNTTLTTGISCNTKRCPYDQSQLARHVNAACHVHAC